VDGRTDVDGRARRHHGRQDHRRKLGARFIFIPEYYDYASVQKMLQAGGTRNPLPAAGNLSRSISTGFPDREDFQHAANFPALVVALALAAGRQPGGTSLAE